MKIAFFSTKIYDKQYFEPELSKYGHEAEFFEIALDEKTAQLVSGFQAICVFVNDRLNKEVIQQLSSRGVEFIALRCAGFNNVDLEACKEFGIKVVRVPAYSPNSVAEHAVALLLTLNRKTQGSSGDL